MTIRSRLDRLRKQIDAALDRALPRSREEPRRIHTAMRYSVFSGGKRIRPAITLLACEACGTPARAALGAACAVEYIHTYSLVHDDLPSMDNDDLRRGKPTCHRAFGEGYAVLAGDALLTEAFALIARSYDAPVVARSVAELAAAAGAAGMVGGQAFDIAARGKPVTKRSLDRTNALKTARLFEASARLGAIVARAGRKKEQALARYGRELGMAFQAVDDCLDGDGAARLIGAAGARQAARGHTDRARAAIVPFGKKAALLSALAGKLADRIR